jgi:hypothetical protein
MNAARAVPLREINDNRIQVRARYINARPYDFRGAGLTAMRP